MNRYHPFRRLFTHFSVWMTCSNHIVSIQVGFYEIKIERVEEWDLQGRSLFGFFLIFRMTDREAADAVIEQWNGKFYPGTENGIPLQVRFAARRRSWRAKEYNSLTQGRPLSPSTQHYYEEQFGQGNMDYPAAQLYANGGNWQQETFNGYPIEAGLEHAGHL
jgi:hypothetical protein